MSDNNQITNRTYISKTHFKVNDNKEVKYTVLMETKEKSPLVTSQDCYTHVKNGQCKKRN